jgi:kumamolisin
VFTAAGDHGSSDGVPGGGVHVDFPASSPHVTGCGGTRLTVTASGTIASQVVWNDDPVQSATGGGFSAFFGKPSYQGTVPGSQRGVPDVAGDADPVTGYPIRVDGQSMVIGGTSAVAPLMSALALRLNQLSGRAIGDFNVVAYANSGDFTDVTQGNNGAFAAGPGWDATTGLGSPVGTKLQATLGAQPSSTGAAPPPAPMLDGDGDLWAALSAFRVAADTLWKTAEVWARSKTLS